MPELVRRLVADDLDVRAVVPATDQGLEDFFLELTARGRGEARRRGEAPAGRRRRWRGARQRREAVVSPAGVCLCPPTPPAKDPASPRPAARGTAARARR